MPHSTPAKIGVMKAALMIGFCGALLSCADRVPADERRCYREQKRNTFGLGSYELHWQQIKEGIDYNVGQERKGLRPTGSWPHESWEDYWWRRLQSWFEADQGIRYINYLIAERARYNLPDYHVIRRYRDAIPCRPS